MKILGLQQLTLLDYPGRLACTVFLGGCNLRCPFCHNASLVLSERLPSPPMPQDELMRFLDSRKGKLTGVCITGGEPTLHRELPQMIQTIKELGYRVKLDTNGSDPQMLRSLIADGLLDYVAMDIKNSPDRYTETCGGVDILDRVTESASILMDSTIDYEFRTTVCRELHDPRQLEKIGIWLKGAKAYYIQQFADSGDLIGSGLHPMDLNTLKLCREAVLPYINNTNLRGI